MGLIVKLLVFYFLTLSSYVIATPEDYYSEEDAKQLTEQTRVKFETNGAVNNQLKDTYFAVEILTKLGSKVPNPSATCQFAKEAVTENNIESVFYSVNIRETLGCGEAASGKVLSTITSTINSDLLVDLVHLVGAVAVLKNNKHIDFTAAKFAPVKKTLLSLVDIESGYWLAKKGQEEGSPYFAGLALSACSQLANLLGDDIDISSAVEAALVLLQNGIEDESRLFFRHNDNSINSLKTTAVVAKGLADIQKVDQSDINEQINLIASFLVSQKYVSSLEDAHSLIVGLSAVNSPVFERPLVLSLVNNQIYATKDKERETNVLVKITDVFGKYTIPVKVYLVRAFRSGREDVSLLSNQETTGVEKNIFSLDFLAARPDPGTYNLEFRVVPQDKNNEFQSVSSAVRRLQVVAAIGLSDGVLEISEQSGSASQHPIQQGQTINKDILLRGQQTLSLTFKLKNLVNSRSVVAHQVFLKLTHRTTKQTKYFVVPHVGQSYELRLSNSKIGKKLSHASGIYDVELLVGDSFISTSFRWVVAKIDLAYEGQTVASEVPNAYGIRPEIQHIFRPAATLAPQLLTYIFTILVIIPFAFFVLSVLRLGGIFNNLPDGITFFSAAIFVGGIGALFGLIILYWFSLKLFTALTYGGLLAVPTIYFGKEALKYNAQHRIKKKTQ